MPNRADILMLVNLHFAVRQINSMASLHSASMILILFCFQIYFIWGGSIYVLRVDQDAYNCCEN